MTCSGHTMKIYMTTKYAFKAWQRKFNPTKNSEKNHLSNFSGRSLYIFMLVLGTQTGSYYMSPLVTWAHWSKSPRVGLTCMHKSIEMLKFAYMYACICKDFCTHVRPPGTCTLCFTLCFRLLLVCQSVGHRDCVCDFISLQYNSPSHTPTQALDSTYYFSAVSTDTFSSFNRKSK